MEDRLKTLEETVGIGEVSLFLPNFSSDHIIGEADAPEHSRTEGYPGKEGLQSCF